VSLPVILRWVHDQPALHPRIGAAERDYVEQHVAAEDAHAAAGPTAPGLRAVLGQPTFLLMLAAGILHNVVAVGLTGWLPTYLAGRAGVQYADLSYLASLPYAASFLGIVVWAGLGDRTGRRAGLAAVTYLLAGACLYAGFNAPGVWATVAAFAGATFCIACYTAMEFALVQRMLPLAHVAAGSGVYNGVSMLLGGGLGPVLLKGIVGADATGAALAPVLVPCALIALLLWRVSRRLAY
jgi:sugar phosphate permease